MAEGFVALPIEPCGVKRVLGKQCSTYVEGYGISRTVHKCISSFIEWISVRMSGESASLSKGCFGVVRIARKPVSLLISFCGMYRIFG